MCCCFCLGFIWIMKRQGIETRRFTRFQWKHINTIIQFSYRRNSGDGHSQMIES